MLVLGSVCLWLWGSNFAKRQRSNSCHRAEVQWCPALILFVYDYFKQYGHTWFWQLWQPKKNTQSLFHGSDQWLQRLNQNVQVKVRLKNKHKKNSYPYIWKLPNVSKKTTKTNVIYSPNQQPSRSQCFTVFHGAPCNDKSSERSAVGLALESTWETRLRDSPLWSGAMTRLKRRLSDFPTDWLGRKPIVVLKQTGYTYIYIFIFNGIHILCIHIFIYITYVYIYIY